MLILRMSKLTPRDWVPQWTKERAGDRIQRPWLMLQCYSSKFKQEEGGKKLEVCSAREDVNFGPWTSPDSVLSLLLSFWVLFQDASSVVQPPILGHGEDHMHSLVPSRPMSPFPFGWEVIWLQLIPGAPPSVTLHSWGPTAQSSLWNCWDCLAFSMDCLTSFLPFLNTQGTLSLQPPFLPAHSPNH